MEYIQFGKTGLKVSRTAFGALPIQRISLEASRKLLLSAYDKGTNFYDTARMYSNSEEKLGETFKSLREKVIIASKSHGHSKKEVLEHLETSLKNLKTDYIDILQLHTPKVLPDPNDPESAYSGLLQAKKDGKIRFIGITNHSLENIKNAITSGLYDTIQFPLSYLSTQNDLSIIEMCHQKDLGLIAMKAMAGGLISSAKAAFSFLRQYDNIVPIWGVQKQEELDEFLAYEASPPQLDNHLNQIIEKDRKELGGSFCRACGYCLPCQVNIDIPWAARMGLLLRRMPYQGLITQEWQDKMALIEKCTDCRICVSRCPYKLDTPWLLKKMYREYQTFLKEKGIATL